MLDPKTKVRVAGATAAATSLFALVATNAHAAATGSLISAATSTAQEVQDNILGASPYVLPIIAVILALTMVIRWVFGLLRRTVGR